MFLFWLLLDFITSFYSIQMGEAKVAEPVDNYGNLLNDRTCQRYHQHITDIRNLPQTNMHTIDRKKGNLETTQQDQGTWKDSESREIIDALFNGDSCL